jgi:CRP-like cAMP-binding protein
MESNASIDVRPQLALGESGGQPCIFGARDDLFKPGDPSPGLFLITAGVACRYSLLASGRRQITAFLLPGDLFGARVFLDVPFDHHLRSISVLDVVHLKRESFASLGAAIAPLRQRAWLAAAQQGAIAREWVLNIGQRTALERVAHLLCELFTRLRMGGLAIGNRCMLPLTQSDLADAVALTPVHFNRTLMDMSRRDWVRFRRGVLEMRNLRALAEIASFDPKYLDVPGEMDDPKQAGEVVTRSLWRYYGVRP